MSVMAADTPAHARRSTAKSRADVWFVLVLTGTASAVLQMWHATHSAGATVPLIAGIVGLVPPAAAIGLSHVVASHKGAVMLRLVTFAVMLGVMAASASAAASVVRPIDGPYFSWVLCLALDAAALACVWVLLGDSERKAAEASALVAAENSAREAGERAREAAGKAARLEAELAEARGALEAVALSAGTARKRAGGTGRKRPGATARKRQPAQSPATAPLSPEAAGMDLDTEALVLKFIGEGKSAPEAGRLAGVTDARGRQIARKLAQPAPATGEQPRVGG